MRALGVRFALGGRFGRPAAPDDRPGECFPGKHPLPTPIGERSGASFANPAAPASRGSTQGPAPRGRPSLVVGQRDRLDRRHPRARSPVRHRPRRTTRRRGRRCPEDHHLASVIHLGNGSGITSRCGRWAAGGSVLRDPIGIKLRKTVSHVGYRKSNVWHAKHFQRSFFPRGFLNLMPMESQRRSEKPFSAPYGAKSCSPGREPGVRPQRESCKPRRATPRAMPPLRSWRALSPRSLPGLTPGATRFRPIRG